ncbi:hypothetical protein ACH41E_00990 [Streptomyces sp. NPDC020412]|uniref:hypothetical protein n=1 Tax=Streptomyces sp. NPDC020412 TaxID=3365073 RepID=UPI00378C3CF0
MNTPLGNPLDETPQYTESGLPVYVVLDTSLSMKDFEPLLNDTLESIHQTIVTSPQVQEFVHLSVLSFNSRAHVVTAMTEIDDVQRLPVVTCSGRTNFGPMIRLVRSRIEHDVPVLGSRGIQVLRPLVFVLTDGAPTDEQDLPGENWHDDLDELLDPGWKPHPNVITYGFGRARESVLRRLSTVAAFVAEEGGDNREALRAAMTSLLNSMVASAESHSLEVPTEVRGYRSVPLDVIFD